ncbi:hypothetical protein ERJ75_000124200 [Trypanosoma vivax]|nr:hypothetical protein ERJ75_000124200 [Trypanosoma vivax]
MPTRSTRLHVPALNQHGAVPLRSAAPAFASRAGQGLRVHSVPFTQSAVLLRRRRHRQSVLHARSALGTVEGLSTKSRHHETQAARQYAAGKAKHMQARMALLTPHDMHGHRHSTSSQHDMAAPTKRRAERSSTRHTLRCAAER